MGFLKKFFQNIFCNDAPARAVNILSRLDDEQLAAHFRIARYGDFLLSEAVRPSYDLEIVPSQGFRHDVSRGQENEMDIPALIGAASKECLFEIFLDLLDPLGTDVGVALDSAHDCTIRGDATFYRQSIDLPVLKSVLWDFEDLLVNDGFTGIAIFNSDIRQEVFFDDHKLLGVYGNPLDAYEQIFAARDVPCNERMKFISEAEHAHGSSDQYAAQFEELRSRLGGM